MARKPRFNMEGIPQHVIQRGNNRQATFFADKTTYGQAIKLMHWASKTKYSRIILNTKH